MKVEIRQSFEKDALKLPAKVQLHVAFLVATLEEADRLTSLKSCKSQLVK